MEENYVFKKESSLGHYVAEAFVVRCFDDRYWKAFKHFLKSLGIKHIDPESVAGGAKIFASPDEDSDREFMLRELEKSVKLHHTKKVMLFTHHDCGAYGGFARFNSDEKSEFEFHTNELKKATEIIKKKFPVMEAESYFINKEGVMRIT